MKTLTELQNYKYRGARALLILQEYGLQRYLETWHKARVAGVVLPQSANPSYKSLDHLLRHVLRMPQSSMTWICEKLGLPNPGINEPPDVLGIAAQADWYLLYLIEKLREPLAEVEAEKFSQPAFESRWKVMYSIEGMLEHMVTHAFRHILQLEELIALEQKDTTEHTD
jgi:hypothetical protein